MRAKKYLFDHLYSQEIVDKNPYHGREKFCVLFFFYYSNQKEKNIVRMEFNFLIDL